MAHVHSHLVVGVGVNRGHQAGLDADIVGQNLGATVPGEVHGHSVRDNGHVALEDFGVDTENNGGVDIATARCRDQHALSALLQQGLCLGLRGVGTSTFQHHIDLMVGPVNSLGILRRIEGNFSCRR